MRIHVWKNRVEVCWGFNTRYVTRTEYRRCTEYSNGHVEWRCSVPWVTEAQCKRLLELDGDWAAFRAEIDTVTTI